MKMLATLVLGLFSLSAGAQVHVYPALDTNNAFSSAATNTFGGPVVHNGPLGINAATTWGTGSSWVWGSGALQTAARQSIFTSVTCTTGQYYVPFSDTCVSLVAALFPGTNGIVFNTSTTAGRNATAADVVGLWASGNCSGFLKSDGTCNTSPGIPYPSAGLVKSSGSGWVAPAYADVVGLWTSCSGQLRSDGTCSPGDVSVTVPSFAIPANTCYGSSGSTTPQTFTMTGLTTSMGVAPRFSGNASALVGWGTTGGLNLMVWPSATNQGSYLVCNPTGSSITGSSITFTMVAQ